MTRHCPSPRAHRPLTAGRLGAAAVELALLLPFLMFLFVISMDFARVFYFMMTLENSARNGAYFAGNYPGIYAYPTLDDAVQADASNLNPSPTYTVRYANTDSGPYTATTPTLDTRGQATGYVQVTVNWQFNTITRYPGVPTQTGLSRTCRMRMAPILP